MERSVTIVNIASGDPDLLNAKTVQAMREGGCLILRTSRSPIVSWLEREKIAFSSLDDLHEAVEDFDQLSVAIAEALWERAERAPVVYGVFDLMTDASVRKLFESKPADGRITVIPGVGLSDLYRSAVCPLLPGADLRTVPAIDFLAGDYDPNLSLLITELDNPILAGDVKLFLSSCLEDESVVYYLHDVSAPPVPLALFELDRQPDIDHLSAVLVPGSDYLNRAGFVLGDLLRIMDRLRAPDGCPWDRVQTHRSLRPYLVEEAWECVAAIEQEDPDHLADELGDLLFQIVFHSAVGKAYDEFTINDVIASICRKMIHRHPHVFEARDSASAVPPSAAEWEKLKRSETGSKSVLDSLDDVSPALPSLKYASKMLKKLSLIPACRRETDEILAGIRRAVDGLNGQDAEVDEAFMGRLLFLVAELCFSLNLDGELLLHDAVLRVRDRVQAAEKQMINDGKSIERLTFAELGVYLNHVEGESE